MVLANSRYVVGQAISRLDSAFYDEAGGKHREMPATDRHGDLRKVGVSFPSFEVRVLRLLGGRGFCLRHQKLHLGVESREAGGS